MKNHQLIEFTLQSKIINIWIDLVNIWNDLINMDDTVIKQVSNHKDMNLNIKNQVKDGIKEAVGEILDDLLPQADNTNLYKNIAFTSSLLFLGYFIFILPGSTINAVELANYNWFNQSLIEFKINLINFFIGGGSNPGNPGNLSSERVDAITTTLNSPVLSSTSSELTEVPMLKQYVEASTQTIYDGTTVSRCYEAVNLMADNLDDELTQQIKDGTHKIIKTITD